MARRDALEERGKSLQQAVYSDNGAFAQTVLNKQLDNKVGMSISTYDAHSHHRAEIGDVFCQHCRNEGPGDNIMKCATNFYSEHIFNLMTLKI